MPSKPSFRTLLVRAGKSALADQITDSAAALAYYTFLAIPAALIVALGIFGLVANPGDVARDFLYASSARVALASPP